MEIYNKDYKLYGTIGNVTRGDDKEVIYLNDDEEKINIVPEDVYLNDGFGGIKRVSDNQNVNVFIEDIQVIPQDKMVLPQIPDFKKHSKYLYETEINETDYEYASKYFKGFFGDNSLEKTYGCTSVWKEGKLYRSFDWYYNEDIAFVTHIPQKEDDFFVHGKRFASSGVAESVPGMSEDLIRSRDYSNVYKLIPFRVVEGANENGVGVSMNVVPHQKGDCPKTIPEEEEKYELQASTLPRFVLDNFETAAEAVDYIKKYVSLYPNRKLEKLNYDVHYIIGDKENVYILEIIDNKIISHDMNGATLKPIITNFHVIKDAEGTLIDVDENGKVYTPADVAEGKLPSSQGITSHGAGLERYNVVVENYDNLDDFRNLVFYNQAYLVETDPQWYSEFVGDYGDMGELTVDNKAEDFEEHVMPIVRDLYKNRNRDDEKTWHTTHTSIYDLNNETFDVYDSTESGVKYSFSI